VLLAFKEYLGLAEHTLAKNLHRLDEEPAEALCTGHAPYSTHRELLRRLKQRATNLGQIFPLHVAEPRAEAEMLASGSGEMVEFIRRRGFWDGSFQAETSASGSMHYLHEHGLLDHRTLCVHAIHVSEAEIRLMARLDVKVCLCPGSNRFLGVGRAPVRRYLEAGILPALGTDSLASNPEISLWREMRLLAEDHADIDPAVIFAMATRGGAAALGLAHSFGALAPGREKAFLAIPLEEACHTASDIHHYLVHAGSAITPDRIAF
jgi:cytosine/adenosine deaminase-related metal-dependent hydrolase